MSTAPRSFQRSFAFGFENIYYLVFRNLLRIFCYGCKGRIRKRVFINKLFDKLSNEEKQKLIDSLDDASNVEIDTLQLPKFTDEQSIDGLDDILKNMGIQSAYSESADFSKIADGIAVSSVNHKAKVIVDENGTKAAAETDIMIKETAMMPSEETYNFIVDKPFVYVIEDQSTGMILFMGRVNSL